MLGPLDLCDRASLAPLVYEILPAGPGKLLNELHIAKSRQLVGAHVFEGEERRIETTDQIACAGRDRCGCTRRRGSTRTRGP